MGERRRRATIASMLPLILLVSATGRLAAQGRDQHEDANAARYDMMLGTPNVYTPSPQTNLFATAPGLEQQARRSQPDPARHCVLGCGDDV